MKYIAKQQIKDLFKNPKKTMESGLWFSGYRGEGEWKRWYENGQLNIDCFYTDGVLDGEFKSWDENGKLVKHLLWKNDQEIEDLL